MNADCSDGETCKTGRCKPATCHVDTDCGGDTHCDLDTSTCQLVSCSDDSTCPCGSYCDTGSHHCRLDCVTGPDSASLPLTCSTPTTCDGRGRCNPTNGPVLPGDEVVLASDPPSAQLTPDTTGAWPILNLTVSLTTKSAVVGPQPAPNVRVVPPADLKVACNTTDPLTVNECSISGSGWAFTFNSATGIYSASRVIRVQIAATTTLKEWPLALITSPLQSNDSLKTIVTLTRRPHLQRAGRYLGTLALGPSGTGPTVPVQAAVTDLGLALVDASRVSAPTGTILLPIDGSARTTSFLGGRKDAALYQRQTATYRLNVGALAFNDLSGVLTGEFTVQLSSSAARQQTWTFRLNRSSDLVASPCPDGEVLDSTLQTCIPGDGWDPAVAGSPPITSASATAWLTAMTPRMTDAAFVTDSATQLAERLMCFDQPRGAGELTNQTRGISLGVPDVSGDLACSAPSANHAWWGIGLLSAAERGSTLLQVDMLSTCLQELARAAPSNGVTAVSITNNECVSLERFYPALFSVAGFGPFRLDGLFGPLQADRRSRLLFQRLLQQWSQLAGFVARNGTSQRGVADILHQLTANELANKPLSPAENKLLTSTGNNVTYAAELDAVNGVWMLLMDQRIHDPLLALPASALASPDYRVLNRPIVYWTFNTENGVAPTASLVGGPSLTTVGTCSYVSDSVFGSASCSPQAALPVLDQDLTVAINWSPDGNLDTHWTGPSTLIDSDALVVKEIQTATGPILQVGHRIADGSVPMVGFRIRSGHFVLRRDTRAQLYLIDDAGDEVSQPLRIAYASPPAVRPGTTAFIASSQSNNQDNLKGFLTDFAIWDSALSAAEAHALATTMQTSAPSARPAWLADVGLPAPGDTSTANDPSVGLPTLLLESLVPTMGLVEAYVNDAANANQVACRAGFPDDGLSRAKVRAADSLRLAYAVEQLAHALYATASSGGAPAWAARYNQAASELAGARSTAIAALVNAAVCQNPMGVGPKEFPLYFNDGSQGFNSPNVIDALQVTALNLKTMANDAITTASNELGAARDAWVAAFNSTVQQQISEANISNRINDIATSYGRDLIDLCGIADTNGESADTVLDHFIHFKSNSVPSSLTVQNCHIQETSACLGNEHTPIDEVNPTCLRGQIGEAWLAAESARQRVVRARIAWNSARAAADGWNKHCTDLEHSIDERKKLLVELEQVQDDEADESSNMEILGGTLVLIGGLATSETGAGVAAALAGFATVVKGLSAKDGDFAARRASLSTLLTEGQLDEQLGDCWFQAGEASIPVAGDEQDIVTASSDLQTALAHATDLQAHAAALVSEATAALNREANQPRPRLAFHYWADEKLAIYQRDLQRAKRMTYLFLRAVEHDLQRSYGLDDAVLGAIHPQQLRTVADFVSGKLGQGNDTRTAELLPTVLSVCEDLLNLPRQFGETDCQSATSKSAQRFREILLSPDNAVYRNGQYLGQVIPFTLTPSLFHSGLPSWDNQCAQQVAVADVRFIGDLDPMPIKMSKREEFYSTTCIDHIADIGPLQDGIHRTSNNMLVEDGGRSLTQDIPFVTGNVLAISQQGDQQSWAAQAPNPAGMKNFAGRGLFGDWQLIVPSGALATIVANPSGMQDLWIRFDVISYEDNGNASASGTRQLTVELDDGSGAVLPTGTGNSVSSSCGTNCPANTTATLTASAATGWHFAEWGGACAGFSTTCHVPMLAARKVWATFVQDVLNVSLTVNATGAGMGGVVTGWTGVVAGPITGTTQLLQQSLPSGTTVTLTAVAPPDSRFTGWTGGGCSGMGTCTVSLASGTGARIVTANFAVRPKLTINVNLDGQADPWRWVHVLQSVPPSGSIICDSVSCSIPFDPGTSLTLTPTPANLAGPPYTFMSWQGACTGSGNCGVTINTDTSVTANFKPAYNIRVDPPLPSYGSIHMPAPLAGTPAIDCGADNQPNSSGCQTWAVSNQSITFTQIPITFLPISFDGWIDSAASCGFANTCSFIMNSDILVSTSYHLVTTGGGDGGGGGGGGGCTGACGEP